MAIRGIRVWKFIGVSIVYLPAEFKAGEYLPLGNPFILKPGGEKQLLEQGMRKMRTQDNFGTTDCKRCYFGIYRDVGKRFAASEKPFGKL